MWRLTAILTVWAGAAAGWEFSHTPICTLSHDTDTAEIRITYDATLPEYRLVVTLTDGNWPEAGRFVMTFAGNHGLTISTDRHVLSDAATSLSVTDSGFGNVLNGLEFNRIATAALGDKQILIPLQDAASAVQQFRTCPAPGLA